MVDDDYHLTIRIGRTEDAYDIRSHLYFCRDPVSRSQIRLLEKARKIVGDLPTDLLGICQIECSRDHLGNTSLTIVPVCYHKKPFRLPIQLLGRTYRYSYQPRRTDKDALVALNIV